jgi:hypothetical protein
MVSTERNPLGDHQSNWGGTDQRQAPALASTVDRRVLAALAPRCEARHATRHFPQVNSSEIHPGSLGISRQAF